VGQNVGEWVRSLGIADPEIRPSHAWRHLFKLAAERAGIPERISDVITGHKAASVGRAYGAPLLSDLAREIEKLPCYRV
jgi:integrase